MRFRRVLATISFLASVLVTLEQVVDRPSPALASITTVTLTEAAPAPFTVPAGVTSLQIKARGGQGGSYGSSELTAGGRGGQIIVSVAVLPGDVFTFEIGRQGSSVTGGATERPGGWPDGGSGYVAGAGNGGGGGGSTRVYRTIAGSPTRILVAAGGGGATTVWSGGAGGSTGGPGYGATAPFDDFAVMSTGGTASAGGSGACIDEEQDGSAGTCANSGGLLDGGDALGPTDGNWGGGGGGGGYYGGGAGILTVSGAGGSSWYDAGRVTFIDGSSVTATGDGVVELVYTVVECEAGTYGAQGKAPCTSARLGYYVPDRLATVELPAPAGKYTNLTGQQSALSCEPGTYQPNEGQISCIPADPGFFVADEGAMEQQPCPAGFTSTTSRATSCTRIPTSSTDTPVTPTTTASAAPTTPPSTTGSATETTVSSSGTMVALNTPRLPRIPRNVKAGKSVLVAAKKQSNPDGLKMSLAARSNACRVVTSSKGFLVIGVKRGVCTLSVRVAGNTTFAARSTTHTVKIS